MMSLFERKKIAEATAFNTVGRLPKFGDRVPAVRLRQVKVRVLVAEFYSRGRRVPEVGKVLTVDPLDAQDLIIRKLAELVS